MKGNKHQIKTPQCCSLCWSGAQSFIFCWQIATEQTNRKYLLVSKIKMLGMLLNVVHRQPVRSPKTYNKGVWRVS